jgi:hypothetical protein
MVLRVMVANLATSLEVAQKIIFDVATSTAIDVSCIERRNSRATCRWYAWSQVGESL